jgi:predicted RNA-binding protein
MAITTVHKCGDVYRVTIQGTIYNELPVSVSEDGIITLDIFGLKSFNPGEYTRVYNIITGKKYQ